LIKGFIKLEEEILTIPDLSAMQIDDLTKLRKGLDTLNTEKNDNKIKLELVEFMNSMN